MAEGVSPGTRSAAVLPITKSGLDGVSKNTSLPSIRFCPSGPTTATWPESSLVPSTLVLNGLPFLSYTVIHSPSISAAPFASLASVGVGASVGISEDGDSVDLRRAASASLRATYIETSSPEVSERVAFKRDWYST